MPSARGRPCTITSTWPVSGRALDVATVSYTHLDVYKRQGHVLVIVHGLPRALGMGRQAAGLLPELAEHLANESGWIVATGTFSGVGGSTGTFSATQWSADLRAILNRVDDHDRRISLAGFGFGGSLALAIAAHDERVRGVATFAAPAHLEHWCRSAEDFHRAVQVAGVVGDEKDVYKRQHPDIDSRFANLGDGTDVVPVSVGLEHRGHAESPCHAQQSVVLVGGVDQGGFARAPTAHDEDVVLHGAHHEAVHLGVGVRPHEFDVVHLARLCLLYTSRCV